MQTPLRKPNRAQLLHTGLRLRGFTKKYSLCSNTMVQRAAFLIPTSLQGQVSLPHRRGGATPAHRPEPNARPTPTESNTAWNKAC